MVSKRLTAAGMAASMVVGQISPAFARPADAPPKEGSLYLQCDGYPNNVTAGETAARLLGAITLLGIFAPPAESADASKRKFGEAGVAACTEILDGPKKEGNGIRRVPLILARALHRIEAKDYNGAIADVQVARDAATAAGLNTNPYYMRSQARAFGMIEAAALYRQGKLSEARDAALATQTGIDHSLFGLLSMPAYLISAPGRSNAEIAYLRKRTRAGLSYGTAEADRLEEFGMFAEAATVRDGLVDYNRFTLPDSLSSVWLAEAGVTHALAGQREDASRLMADAKANFEARRAAGKPESNAAEYVELVDLYTIVDTASKGDLKAARRLFSARSQWIAPSLGAVMEVNRRLRAGASPDELIGGLADSPEKMQRDKAAAMLAEVLQKDTENKNLFWLIPNYMPAAAYESLSRTVWKTDKSRLLIKADKDRKNKSELLLAFGQNMYMTYDEYALHAALLAKSRGHRGFVIYPIITEKVAAAGFLTGNAGDPGLPATLFNDADEVIADLSLTMPSPDTLAARAKTK